MKVVYCHNRNIEIVPIGQDLNAVYGEIKIASRGGSTVAMEAIPSWLLDTLEIGSTIVRKVGIARCSDDDNYCKKTGRELAQTRLKQTTLKVVQIIKFPPAITVFFEDESGNLFEVKKTNDPYCARLIRMLDE